MTYPGVPLFRFADEHPAELIGEVTVHRLSDSELILESDLKIPQGEEVLLSFGGETIAGHIAWASDRIYGCARADAPQQSKPTAPGQPSITHTNGKAGTRRERGEARRTVFAARFAALRRGRGLTLADIAVAVGVSKPTVWAWENGKALPLPERLRTIADLVGIPLRELRQLTTAETAPEDDAGARGPKDVIRECRERIAEALDIDPVSVRIGIEF